MQPPCDTAAVSSLPPPSIVIAAPKDAADTGVATYDPNEGLQLRRTTARVPRALPAFVPPRSYQQQQLRKAAPVSLSPSTPVDMQHTERHRRRLPFDLAGVNDVAVIGSDDSSDCEDYIRLERRQPRGAPKQQPLYRGFPLRRPNTSVARTQPPASSSEPSPTSSSSSSSSSDNNRTDGGSISNSTDSVETGGSWEDDDSSPFALCAEDGQEAADDADNRHYTAEGKLVFKFQIPRPLSKKSLLSEAREAQRARAVAGAQLCDPQAALGQASSRPRPVASAAQGQTQTQTARPRRVLPNPLRCHPTSLPASPLSASPKSSAAPAVSTLDPMDTPFFVSASSASRQQHTRAAAPMQNPCAPAVSADRLMFIPQVSGGSVFKHRTPHVLYTPRCGRPLLTMPFNGASGPRANPLVVMGDTRFRELSNTTRCVASELSASVRAGMVDENRTRYIFRHYGLREPVGGVLPAADGAVDEEVVTTLPHCTQSNPELYQRGADRRHPGWSTEARQPRQYRLVRDYASPESWGHGLDYHSKGW